jgi:hypothetical protein
MFNTEKTLSTLPLLAILIALAGAAAVVGAMSWRTAGSITSVTDAGATGSRCSITTEGNYFCRCPEGDNACVNAAWSTIEKTGGTIYIEPKRRTISRDEMLTWPNVSLDKHGNIVIKDNILVGGSIPLSTSTIDGGIVIKDSVLRVGAFIESVGEATVSGEKL